MSKPQPQQQQQQLTDKPRKSGALVAFCGRRSACGGGRSEVDTHPESEYKILSSLLGELGMSVAVGNAFHILSYRFREQIAQPSSSERRNDCSTRR